MWLRRYLQEYCTLEEIAEAEGITREGVRQRLKSLGIEPRTQSDTSRLREQRQISLKAVQIRQEFLKTRSIEETATVIGLPAAWVERFVGAQIPDFRVLSAVPRRVTKKYSEEDLLASLRHAATTLSGNLTADAYVEFTRNHGILPDGRPRPGMQVMLLRFGSWRAGLEAAGLPANAHSGPKKAFNADDAVAAVVRSWRDVGKPPTVGSYDRWQQAHKGHPSPATVRKLTGNWNELLVRCWQIVHGLSLEQEDESIAVPKSSLATDPESHVSDVLVTYYAADEGVQIELSNELVDGGYLALERAVRSHASIQNAVAEAAKVGGMQVWSPALGGPQFDIALSHKDGRQFVVEVKSATEENIEFQLRVGLGQVLRYAHQLCTDRHTYLPVIALELRPDESWINMLRKLGVGVLVSDSIGEDLEQLLRITGA